MQTWQKIIIITLVIGCVAGGYKYYIDSKHELERAKALTEQQTKDTEALKQELKINQEQAKKLSKELQKAQDNKIQPVTNITVQAPDINTAVDNVTDRINKQDTSLPPQVLEHTDRTVVAPQPQNKDYSVGVYKINLDKKHKIKAGATVIDNKPYWSIGYQQKRAEIIIHGQDKVKGISAMYTIKEW